MLGLQFTTQFGHDGGFEAGFGLGLARDLEEEREACDRGTDAGLLVEGGEKGLLQGRILVVGNGLEDEAELVVGNVVDVFGEGFDLGPGREGGESLEQPDGRLVTGRSGPA